MPAAPATASWSSPRSSPARRFGAPRPVSSNGWVRPSDPGAISLLAIAAYDIPTEFPAAALAEAAAAPPVDPGRPDRSARSAAGHDRRQRRARFRRRGLGRARPRPGKTPAAGTSSSRSPMSPGMCAPGSALDREAERRGNSVYFPDRVVPMLPEALSNDLCSLKPGVDRACLAVHLWIDAAGRKRRHRFERARHALGRAADLRRGRRRRGTARRRTLRAAAPEPLAALYGAFAALDRGAARARRAGARPRRGPGRARRRRAARRDRAARPGSTATG